MYSAKLVFGKAPKRVTAKTELLVDLFLADLSQAGQIGPITSFCRSDGELTAFIDVSRPDSLEIENYSKYGGERLDQIRKEFGQAPALTILDDDVPSRFPSLKSASFLVLSGDFWRNDHPVRRGRDGYGLPAYLLQLDQIDPSICHNLHVWKRRYEAYFDVWFHTATLEMPAYREIAEPKSALSREARDYCKDIEQSTGIPTYYHLYRYYGKRGDEKSRRCPLCGDKWLLEKPYINKQRDWEIYYLCEKCRITSDRSRNFDEPRLCRYW